MKKILLLIAVMLWFQGCANRSVYDKNKISKYLAAPKNVEKFYGKVFLGKANGYGVIRYSNGDKFEGDLKKGELHGEGEIHYKNGDWIWGKWENGELVQIDKGKVSFSDSNKLLGIIASGYYKGGLNNESEPEGFGTYYSLNGDWIEGVWKNWKGDLISENVNTGNIFDILDAQEDISDIVEAKRIKISGAEASYEGEVNIKLEPEGEGKWTFKNGDWVQVFTKEGVDETRDSSIVKMYDLDVDGCTYEGKINLDHTPHGRGKITWNDGVNYEGNWENGKIAGEGKYTWENGDWVEVFTKDGVPETIDSSIVKMYDLEVDGYTYEGKINTFHQPHGKGKITWKIGGNYEGGWNNGNWNGEGKYTWENGKWVKVFTKDGVVETRDSSIVKMNDLESAGDIYEGKINLYYQPHGEGRYTYKNGDWYEGEWKDGKRIGVTRGKKTYSYGNYIGELNDNLEAHGYGVHDSSIGKYEGNWKNDERHGKGKYTYKNGDWYEGEWENGSRIAVTKGKQIYSDGYYIGDLDVDLERDGYGVYYWEDGDKYEGNWENGKMHGEGKYTWENGGWYNGEWKEGKRVAVARGKEVYDNGYYIGDLDVDLERDGYGVYYWEDGDKYEGYWKNSDKHGKGKLTWSNGDWVRGSWKYDEPYKAYEGRYNRRYYSSSDIYIENETFIFEIPDTSSNSENTYNNILPEYLRM